MMTTNFLSIHQLRPFKYLSFSVLPATLRFSRITNPPVTSIDFRDDKQNCA
jgi:hypothetical protein